MKARNSKDVWSVSLSTSYRRRAFPMSAANHVHVDQSISLVYIVKVQPQTFHAPPLSMCFLLAWCQYMIWTARGASMK